MNKTIITLIGFLAIMFFSGNVYAITIVTPSAGGTVTVADTSTSSAPLTFTPSPGIVMGGATSATLFTIVAGNTKAGTDAIVVGVISSTPTIYQLAQDLSAVTAGTGLTGDAGTAGDAPATFKQRN